MAKRISFPDLRTCGDRVLEVHRRDHAHADRDNRCQSAVDRLQDDRTPGLQGLPAVNIGKQQVITFVFFFPDDYASRRVICRNHLYFSDRTGHREMVSVIIKCVQKGMGQFTTRKGVCVFAVSQQGGNIPQRAGLDGDAPAGLRLRHDYIVVRINIPYTHGQGVCRKYDNRRIIRISDRTAGKITQPPGKELIESMPVGRIFVQILIQVHGFVFSGQGVVFFIPGRFRVQVTAAGTDILHDPAAERFVVKKGIVVIPAVCQFFQGLITDEIEHPHSLFDPLVECQVFRLRERLPRCRFHRPVQKTVKRTQRICRIGGTVRIGVCRL